MQINEFYPLAQTLPDGAFSEYDMEAMAPALEAIPEDGIYLEIGVDRGKSLAFARTLSHGKVYGIDKVDNLWVGWFKDKKQWFFINAPSNEAASHWNEIEPKAIDVLFIDGDHTYEGCLADWQNFAPFVKPGGIIFFHDGDETSPGVVQVFEDIKKDQTFTFFTNYKQTLKKNTSMLSCRRKE